MAAEDIAYVLQIILMIFAMLILWALVYAIACNLWESHKLRKLIRTWEDDKVCLMDHHISEDPIEIGDPHSDTIERSFTKNDFRYSDEQFVYIFKDGLKETRSSPYNHLELLELVKKHGSCELEVVKL